MDQLGYVPPNVFRVSASSGDCCDDSVSFPRRRDDDDVVDDDAYSTMAIDTSNTGMGRPIAIQSYPLLMQLRTTYANSNTDGDDDPTMNEVHYKHEDCNVTPFPTLYWLTCPHVSRAISELERLGHVRAFQLELENDPQKASGWRECHKEYGRERWSILSDRDREWLSQREFEDDEVEERKRRSMREMIRLSGVAGTDHRGLREKDVPDAGDDADDNFVPSVKCLHSHYAHYRSQLSRDNNSNTAMNLVGKWTHESLMEHFPDLAL